MRKIMINGYFTVEHINGIPRYATEVVKRMDKLFNKNELELVVPNNAANVPKLENIRVVSLGEKSTGIVWGLKYFEKYVRKNNGVCINFTYSAIHVQDSITAIHDTIPLRRDQYDIALSNKDLIKLRLACMKNRLAFRWKAKVSKKMTKSIVTVSDFAKQCIVSKLNIDGNKIRVIGNGWEHIEQIECLDEHKDGRIEKNKYFLTLGNLFPHKNINWVLNEAKYMPNEIFVIAGKMPYNFIENFKVSLPNVVFLGYVSEQYMKYLIKNCKALLFPSLEEGFGIPPLEALALGTQVIASDIPVMHEIYGDSIHYVNAKGKAVDLDKILQEKVESSEHILKENSWEVSAKKWAELVKEMYF